MTAEQWRWIPGHEGRYEVSSCGRVMSVRFRNKHVDKERVCYLKPSNSGRYAFVSIPNGRGGFGPCYIHRLVLLAFRGAPPDARYQAAHLNGDAYDNRLENLAWVSKVENEHHKELHGTIPYGEKNASHKLTDEQVREIRASKDGTFAIATRYGIHHSYVSMLRNRRWRKTA